MNATRVRWLNWFVVLVFLWLPGLSSRGASAQPPLEPAAPQGNVNLTLAGQAGGSVKALVIEGNYAYMGVGARLVVMDITDPAQPVLFRQTEPLSGTIRDVVIAWPTVFLATSYGIEIVDVDFIDHTLPVNKDKQAGTFDAIAYDPIYQTLYAVGGDQLSVWDMYDVNAIAPMSTYTSPSYSWSDVVVESTNAYITGEGEVRMLNISNPYSLTVTTSQTITGTLKSTQLASDGSFLYVAACERGVQIFSASTLSYIGGAVMPYVCAQGVSIDGTTAYVSAGLDGLRSLDVLNRVSPLQLGQLDTPGITWMAVSNGMGHVFLADDDGLRSVNVSSPVAPYTVGQFITHGQADFVTGVDNSFYAMDKHLSGGLRTYSITTPTTPTFQSTTYNEWGDATNVAVLNDYAYSADSYLHTFNLSNPAHPFWVSSFDLPFSAYHLAAFNHPTDGRRYVCIAAGAKGLQIVDITDHQNMKLVGAALTSDAQGVFVLEKYAFVADGLQGLKIFDLTNPASPQWKGTFDTAGYAWRVTVIGGTAYVADGSQGLQIVDVNNPVAPVAGGSYDTPGEARQVRVLGKFAFIADDFGGLVILDIANPATPLLDSTYAIPGIVTDLSIADGRIVVAAGDAGLFVYQVNYNPAYILSGKVTDSASNPVQGVAMINPGTGYILHTDGTGNYLFFHMPAGKHYVRPNKSGYSFTPTLRVPILPPAATGQDFTATAVIYNVTGRVTDSLGRPLAGINVADGLGNSTTTNASGDYTLPLTAGPHHFGARINQWALWPPERFVDIPPGADMQDFTIPAPVNPVALLYGGDGKVVARNGNMLYLQTGTGLAALNISRPYTPTLTGKTAPLPGNLRALSISGRYAYAALDAGGLGVIDLIDPARPVIQGILPFPGRVLGVLATGTQLYMTSDLGLTILDLSMPTKPQPIGSLMLDGDGPLALRNGRIYLATVCNRLAVVNVSTPANPTLLGSVSLPSCVQDLAVNVSGNYVYMALGRGNQNGLHVLDVTYPLTPTLVYTESLPISDGRLAWDGNFVYYAAESLGVHIYDVSNPANVTLSGSVSTQSAAYDSVLIGNTLYQTTVYDGLRVIDVTSRTAPVTVGAYTDDLPEFGKDVFIQGGYAYLADYDGLRLYDITSPHRPIQLSNTFIGNAISVAAQEKFAYVGTNESGLYVYDVTDPQDPIELTRYAGLGNVSDIAVAGNHAYLTGEGPGLRIFEIAPTGFLKSVGAYSILTDTVTIHLDGNLAYIIQPQGGLHVVNVSNPANPAQVGVYNPPQQLYGVDVIAGRIYLAGENGLTVLNSANLTAAPLGFFATSMPLYDVRVVGNFAYLAAQDGLLAVNIANPARMVEANYLLNASGVDHSLALGGNYLYFVNEHAGLTVYQLGQPAPLKVSPLAGVNTAAQNITIRGLNFQPDAQAFLGNASLTSVSVISSTQMTAVVPAGLLPATYALRVVNPDGGAGLLPLAYTVYANTPPSVTQVTPAQGANNLPVIVEIVGSNFAPGLSVKLNGPQNVTFNSVLYLSSTHLRLALPPGLATGAYDLTVINPNNQAGTLPAAYIVRTPAELDDLSAIPTDLFVRPYHLTRGVPVQLALTVRRQGGATVLARVAVDFYDGNPQAGGVLIGSSNAFRLPPNGVVTTIPITWTPATAGPRQLVAVIDPAGLVVENSETNNSIGRPIMVYLPFGDVTPPEINSLSINQGAATTSDPLVTLNLITSDDASGVRSLFFVEYEYIQSQADWVVTALSGWLPSDEVSQDYPWQLTPGPGVHYLQAFAADWAGNISPIPAMQFINYLPDTAAITTYEVHTYRLALNAGDSLQAALTSLAGDADLYIFAPNGSLMGKSETGGADGVTFTAPTDGVYQIEIEGAVGSTYQLVFTLNGSSLPALSAPEQPHPRGRGSPNSMPGDVPGDDVGLPSPIAGYATYLPLIMR